VRSTDAAGQAAAEQESGAQSPAGTGDERAGLHRWVLVGLVGVLVLAGGAVIALVTGALGGVWPGGVSPGGASAGPGLAAGASDRTSAVPVARRSLTAQLQVSATLGDAGSYTVVNQAAGTITALPAVGRVVRQGQVLYQVNGSPVVLLYGNVPSYRDLGEGATGPDVTELNADLVRLGDATRAELGPRSGWSFFGVGTASGLERLQERLGAAVPTGELTLGSAVFLPGAAKITGLGADVTLGAPATPGTALLTASSTRPVVTISLDPAQQTEVRAGDRVTVTLPGGTSTPGVVSSVGKVVTAPPSDGADGSDGSGGSATAAITVTVTLDHPRAAGHLDQAPVEVAVTTGRVTGVLTVPVDALLAQSDGGYAVEVAGPGATRHLVPVALGLFDDDAGLVQVTGSALAAGQRVVVPAI
jgi:hypothetical protein